MSDAVPSLRGRAERRGLLRAGSADPRRDGTPPASGGRLSDRGRQQGDVGAALPEKEDARHRSYLVIPK